MEPFRSNLNNFWNRGGSFSISGFSHFQLNKKFPYLAICGSLTHSTRLKNRPLKLDRKLPPCTYEAQEANRHQCLVIDGGVNWPVQNLKCTENLWKCKKYLSALHPTRSPQQYTSSQHGSHAKVSQLVRDLRHLNM